MKRLLVAATTLGSVLASVLIAPPAQANPAVTVMASASSMDIVSTVDGLSLVVESNATGQEIIVTANVNLTVSSGVCQGDGGSRVTCQGAEFTQVSISLFRGSSGDGVTVGDYPAHPLKATIYGTDGDDTFMTDNGDDTLFGYLGDDKLEGLDGFDQLIGGGGADKMNDNGMDGKSAMVLYLLADYEAWRTMGVSVTLDGVANDGSVQDGGIKDNVGSGVRFVTGTDFADVLVGDDQNNSLDGMGGDDTLTGGLGVDAFYGKFGNDTIYARDGVKDYEINCNNSDGSRTEQPNTAYVDANDPEAQNCSDVYRLNDGTDSGGGSGSGGGGSGSGGGASETVYSTAQPVNTNASWTVPADLLPQANPAIKNGYSFSSLSEVQESLSAVRMPIMVSITRHPLSEVPSQYQPGIENGEIFDVNPPPGTKIDGSATAPAAVTLHVYESSEDPIRKKKCPFVVDKDTGNLTKDQSRIIDMFDFLDLWEAESLAERLKCEFEVVKFKNNAFYNIGMPMVGKVDVVRNKSGGKARFMMEWTVFNPTQQGLALMVGPRDPNDWTTSPKRADDFDEEMTLDTNLELHAATGSKKTDNVVRVWVLNKSDGLFVGKATVAAWFGGEMIREVQTTVGSGGVTLNLPLREYGVVRITALYEDANGNATSGFRDITVRTQDDFFVTADGRCFEEKNRNWKTTDCPTNDRKWNASAKGLRDAFVATGFTGADQIKDGNPIKALRKASKELKTVPGFFGPGPESKNGIKPSKKLRMKGAWGLDWVVSGAQFIGKAVAAVAKVADSVTKEVVRSVKGAVRTISTAATNAGVVLGITPKAAHATSTLGYAFRSNAVVDGSKAKIFKWGAFTQVVDAVAKLKGSTLINLDGGTLAPPSGTEMGPPMLSPLGDGTAPDPSSNQVPLINLDAGTLINLDGSG